MDRLWSETCWTTFKYFFNFNCIYILCICISWLIKYLIIIDARCKHEDNKSYLTLCKKSNKRRSSEGTVCIKYQPIRKVTFHVDVTNDAYLRERTVDVLHISSLHCSNIFIFSFSSLSRIFTRHTKLISSFWSEFVGFRSGLRFPGIWRRDTVRLVLDVTRHLDGLKPKGQCELRNCSLELSDSRQRSNGLFL